MANEQLPLIFFNPLPAATPPAVAQAILTSASSAAITPLDPTLILQTIQKTRGFARLKIALPHFTLDNPRTESALEGTAQQTHIDVHFFGNFEKLAHPLFKALHALGLTCYSVWDKTILTDWPQYKEPIIDSGFAARMARILERKTAELRTTVPDQNQRTKILDAFLKGPEFRAAMAAEAKREKSTRKKKAYAELVNCHIRWKTPRPSAAELIAIRKLHPDSAGMSIADLRIQIGNSPRFLLQTAISSNEAAKICRDAQQLGICLELESL